jgi:hypothetical protein
MVRSRQSAHAAPVAAAAYSGGGLPAECLHGSICLCLLLHHAPAGSAITHPAKVLYRRALKAVAVVQAKRHAHSHGALCFCIPKLSCAPEQLQRELVVHINALATLQEDQQHQKGTTFISIRTCAQMLWVAMLQCSTVLQSSIDSLRLRCYSATALRNLQYHQAGVYPGFSVIIGCMLDNRAAPA